MFTERCDYSPFSSSFGSSSFLAEAPVDMAVVGILDGGQWGLS